MARLDYFAPGIYVEEVDRGSRPIEGVSTAVAGFMGFTEDIRGGAELFKPMLVTSWTQYLKYFAKPNSTGFTSFNAYLPFAVHGYFMNGGGRCYISSIGTQLPLKLSEQSQPVQTELPSALKIPMRGNRPCLNLLLRPEKAADGAVQVVVSSGTPRALPPASEGDGVEAETPKAAPRNTGEFFTLQIKQQDEVLEQFDHLTYLLQRMEAYAGLAILTTNFPNNLDSAFLRRLRFVVQFPFPSITQRTEIWRRVFPPDTPVKDLKFDKLAQLNVAGGNIRIIALNAAFLAAEAKEPVPMKHLLQASQTEYTKLEKSLTEVEIAGWV